VSSFYPEPDIQELQVERLTAIVSRFLRIDDITEGKKDFLVRYRGMLYSEDTAKAYDDLAAMLKPLEITPLFRLEGERHVILLMKGVIRPKESNPKVNIILFVLTVFSVLLAGTFYSYSGPVVEDQMQQLRYLFASLGSGLPFAVSFLAILLAHEFGHYLAGRFHGTKVTLPYFIPFPLSQLGTMGAFISIKELPKNRRVMLDIGLAGPLAGLAVAIPVLILGISLSEVHQLPTALAAQQGLSLEGNSILYLLIKYLVKGELLPQPVSYGGMSPWLYWLRYFFTGTPIPWGGRDVLLHPIAWAGWAGLLITALNLIPAGQLDGGHIMYILLGKNARKLVPFILAALFLLGLAWSGWWFWAFLILLFGRFYMEPLDQITRLDPPRKALATLGVIIFILVFVPVPLLFFGG